VSPDSLGTQGPDLLSSWPLPGHRLPNSYWLVPFSFVAATCVSRSFVSVRGVPFEPQATSFAFAIFPLSSISQQEWSILTFYYFIGYRLIEASLPCYKSHHPHHHCWRSPRVSSLRRGLCCQSKHEFIC
jgi:hypothetical protein